MSNAEKKFDISVDSMALVTDTADFVDTVMRGVVSDEFTPETAGIICRCSGEIFKLMDLRWKIVKAVGGHG